MPPKSRRPKANATVSNLVSFVSRDFIWAWHHNGAGRKKKGLLRARSPTPGGRIRLTSSGVTGLWLVFLSSSMTLGSRLKSFLQPTRMIGRPAQKCMTSEIHCKAGFVVERLSEQLRTHLFLNVVQGIRTVDGETDENDVRVGIWQGSETVIVFLACGIPQGEFDVLAVYLDVGDIVLEYGGYVDLEGVSEQQS